MLIILTGISVVLLIVSSIANIALLLALSIISTIICVVTLCYVLAVVSQLPDIKKSIEKYEKESEEIKTEAEGLKCFHEDVFSTVVHSDEDPVLTEVQRNAILAEYLCMSRQISTECALKNLRETAKEYEILKKWITFRKEDKTAL